MSQIRETFETLGTHGLAWWQEVLEFAEQPVFVQYEIEDSDGGSWHVILNNRPTCQVREGAIHAPNLRLRLSGIDWLDIVAGRSSVWSLLASGRVRATGDHTLIGVVNLLGLLGRPVTPVQVAEHEHRHWVARAPDFVVPRVLTEGRIDYDKWRYFAEQGALRAYVPKGAVPWHILSKPAVTAYAPALRPVLRPLYWRRMLLGPLPDTPVTWLQAAASVILLATAASVFMPWRFLLPLLAASFLLLNRQLCS